MPDSLLPKVPLEGPPQLTNCDREPIHIPGSIQPHGYLLAVDQHSGQVDFVSQNIDQILQVSAHSLVGHPYQSVLPWLPSLLDSTRLNHEGQRTLAAPFALPGGSVTPTLHRCDGYWIIELEPTDPGNPIGSRDLIRDLFASMAHVQTQEAYEIIVQQVRDFAGFDRVMLYQLLEDGHGVVVAESCDSSAESFLGLHYPATDIPQPARRLYELNWLRLIADLTQDPVPLVAAQHRRDDLPLNLTYAGLRSISPIHIEYLRNMQVAASMSISVMDGQRLWGLIACHHNSPKIIPTPMRDTCELSGAVLSAYLTSRRQQDYLARQVEIQEAIQQQLATLAQFGDWQSGLERLGGSLCQLLQSQGMVWRSSDDLFCWGEVPGHQDLMKIFTELDSRPQENLAYTDQISQWLLEAEHYADRCSGLLALRLGQWEGGTLMFFRSPYEDEITWAGNPNKSVANEDGRLTPRKSFQAWKQSIKGRSRPWSDANLETARSLFTGLQSVVVEQNSELRRMNEELTRLNTDLDAFAYAASHDLKEPLRGLYHYVFLLEQTESRDDPDFDGSLDGLKKIVRRMGDLLDGLLRFSRAGRSDLFLEEFSLDDVVQQAQDVIFSGMTPDNVHVQVQSGVELKGDFACVREILTNLISNGIKYNSSPSKTISIGTCPRNETPLRHQPQLAEPVVFVRDNGIGIPPEQLPRIFEIFTRLHHRDAYGGGSGAGLTIVRRLVERHGGSIQAESHSDGSTFYFSLGRTDE